jgi:hypothetical protein
VRTVGGIQNFNAIRARSRVRGLRQPSPFAGYGGITVRHAPWLLVLAVTLCGCVEAPPLNLPQKHLTVRKMIEHIACEIHEAIQANPHNRKLENDNSWGWVAVGALTVRVDDEGSLAATSSFINPLTATTSFAFGIGGGITADRELMYTENFTIYIKTLEQTSSDYDCRPLYGNPLFGDLALRQTIELGLRSGVEDSGGPIVYASQNQSSANGAFGQTIQFQLQLTLTGLGPTWTLLRFKGPTGNLGGAYRKDTNELVISFAPATKAPPPPLAGGGGHFDRLNFSRHAHPAISLGTTGGGGNLTGEDAASANNFLMLLQSGKTRPGF